MVFLLEPQRAIVARRSVLDEKSPLHSLTLLGATSARPLRMVISVVAVLIVSNLSVLEN